MYIDPVAIYSHVAATSFFFQQVFWNTGAIQNLYTWRDMNECSGTLPDRNEESLYYNIQGFTDCKNDACHILFIQCEKCNKLYNGCCSRECKDFAALPIEKQKKLRKDPERIISRTFFDSRIKPRMDN